MVPFYFQCWIHFLLFDRVQKINENYSHYYSPFATPVKVYLNTTQPDVGQLIPLENRKAL